MGSRWPLKILLFLMIAIGTTVAIHYFMLNSRAHTAATAFISGSSQVVGVVGTPVRERMTIMGGQLSVSGDSGAATYDFIATGPKGSAKLEIVLEKKAGLWSVVSGMIDGQPLDVTTIVQAKSP